METRPGPFSGKLTQADVELAAALEDAKAHYEGWSHVSQVLVDGCTVELYRQALESGLYEYYATGELPLSPEELLEVNWDLEYRLRWDEYAKDIRKIGSETHEGVEQEQLHWEVKFPWPLSNRDYVFVRHRGRVGDRHVLVSKGSSSPQVPEAGGVVRVEQLRNLMSFVRDPERPERLRFCLLYFDDLKHGFSLLLPLRF